MPYVQLSVWRVLGGSFSPGWYPDSDFKIIRLLSTHVELEHVFKTNFLFPVSLGCAPAAIRWMIREAGLSYQDWKLEARLLLTLRIGGFWKPDFPDFLRAVMEDHPFDARVCAFQDERGKTLLY